MATVKSLVTHILQNILFCAQQKKETLLAPALFWNKKVSKLFFETSGRCVNDRIFIFELTIP